MYQKVNKTEGWQDYIVVDADTGEMIKHVIEADENTGFYRQYRVDEQGHIQLFTDPHGNKFPVSNVCHGKIKFVRVAKN